MEKLLGRRLATSIAAVAMLVPVRAPAAEPVGRELPVVDGAPTPEACLPLGFNVAAQTNASPLSSFGVAPGIYTPSADLPPPPSLPIPPTPPPLPLPPVPAPIKQSRELGQSERYVPVAPLDTARYPHVESNAVHETAADPVSTFSIDVDTASYSKVRRFLNRGERPPVDAVRPEELINYFPYDYPAPATAARPFRAAVAVAPSPWNKGRQVMRIGLRGFAPPQAKLPPLNLVFLVDTSGSMMPADRLPLAVQSLNVLIDQLRPQDRVALAAYAGSAGEVLGPTSGAQKLKLRCALKTLSSGGSTAGGAGLNLAYALAQRDKRAGDVSRVILMTDGDFNVGLSGPQALKAFITDKRKTGVYLSVYGFGNDNYKDDTMQALAQAGNGTAGFIDELSEARKVFRDDFTRQIFPIANDVKIQVEFNPRAISEYRLVGYETRLLQREDFNNDQVDAGEVGAGATVTAIYEIALSGGPRSVDPLRYGARSKAKGDVAELAFLRVRWKPPGGATSKLIERPVTRADVASSLSAAPESLRFATAVAGFAQLLRGDTHVGSSYGFDDVRREAQGSVGADPLKLRREFVDLVEEAAHAAPRS